MQQEFGVNLFNHHEPARRSSGRDNSRQGHKSRLTGCTRAAANKVLKISAQTTFQESGTIRCLFGGSRRIPRTMCFVYITRAKRNGTGLQTRSHARTQALHKRGVIYSASKTQTCTSKPRHSGGPRRHLLPAERTSGFDGSPGSIRTSARNTHPIKDHPCA